MADLEEPLVAMEAGEGTPLVNEDRYDAENEPPPLTEIKENTLKEKIVAGAATVTFGTSIGAMVVENHPSVYVSGALGAMLAPYAAFQQQKITQVEALKETNGRMAEEVDQLKFENMRLQSSVSELDESVTHLKEMEDTLRTIETTKGQSIKELERQLKESQQILNSMKSNLKADVLQNLISVVLACDDDGDMILSDSEIDQLIGKLEGLSGVQLKEEKLRNLIIDKGRSLNAIMTVARELLDDEGARDRIFEFVEKK